MMVKTTTTSAIAAATPHQTKRISRRRPDFTR
jgi:hypothetical protein